LVFLEEEVLVCLRGNGRYSVWYRDENVFYGEDLVGILMVLSKHGGREGHLAWQETRVF
jgi:hypothetical protein